MEKAKKTGKTRASLSFTEFKYRLNGGIVVIGNAPTALFTVLELLNDGIKPQLVVGIPVGFVGAKESKDQLVLEKNLHYITVLGNKGGSPAACAAINALIRLAI